MQASHLNTPPATPPPASSITNAQLNLSVLQRHDSSIIHVLSIAPYSVIYIFSAATQSWEKSGTEGTLFVCQLRPLETGPEERYAVFVLNRRGLDNFELELLNGESVEVTEEYVILQSQDLDTIYGVWIFAEPAPSSTADMRSINAKVIHDCAIRAEASRDAARQKSRSDNPQTLHRQAADDQFFHTIMRQQQPQQQPSQEQPDSVAMARQLSLRELFGQPRHDNHPSTLQNWPVSHTPTAHQGQHPQHPYNLPQHQSTFHPPSQPPPHFQNSHYPHPQQQHLQPLPQPQNLHFAQQDTSQGDVLGNLFQRARQGYGYAS